MNKKIIIPAVVSAILILAGAGYVLFNRQSPLPQNQSAQTQPSPNLQTAGKKSLIDLINFSGSQQCSFTDTETNNTGTIFVSSGKMRGDFESAVDSDRLTTHMISNGSEVYIWTDAQKEGIKMSLEKISQYKDDANKNSLDINKQIDYRCGGWSEDPVKFTLPTEIKFNDFSAMMPTAPASTSPGDANSAQCSACENLPEEAQAQCKKALSCN